MTTLLGPRAHALGIYVAQQYPAEHIPDPKLAGHASGSVPSRQDITMLETATSPGCDRTATETSTHGTSFRPTAEFHQRLHGLHLTYDPRKPLIPATHYISSGHHLAVVPDSCSLQHNANSRSHCPIQACGSSPNLNLSSTCFVQVATRSRHNWSSCKNYRNYDWKHHACSLFPTSTFFP